MEVLMVSGLQLLLLFIGTILKKQNRHPYCYSPFAIWRPILFMSNNYNPRQALEEMHHYYNVVKAVNGTFIMIWHNHFLGTDRLYAGWREMYEQFIDETAG